MITITVTEEEEGQRLDKYLHRHLPYAPASFFYRMLRKKNITRNGKRRMAEIMWNKGMRLRFIFPTTH